jgi:arylsulfatase A-like enzyme
MTKGSMLNRVMHIGSLRGSLLLLAALLCLLTFKSFRPAERSNLNVLLITLDTIRADAVGTYGGRAITPSLDHLASTGVVFEQTSTVAPLTLPAHCSLFTALFPPGHQVHLNGQPLATNFVTLAERLSARGFETGAFISSFVLDRKWGLNQGFDVYRDVDTPSGATNQKSLRRSADRVVDEALGWLETRRGPRFFGWLHFYDAHAPAQAPTDFASPNGQNSYLGAIGFIDLQISRVITFLAERHLLDRTIVVIVGDHGESLGEHGEPGHGLFVYESVVRIPLIVRAPFANMQARRVADPVRIVDIVPTVLNLLGEAAASETPGLENKTRPTSVDGRTLVPLMSGAVNELGLDAYSESRYGFDRFGWSPLVALRRGNLKLIVAPRPELYDLAADPHELTNIYSQRETVTVEMTRRLEEIGQSGDVEQPTNVSAIDSVSRARLATLGYVSGSFSRSSTGAAPLADPKDRIDLYRQFTERPHPPGVLP